MRFVKTAVIALTLTLLFGVCSTSSRADQWDKKTIVTFDQPVEIPGMVLPAGTYVFRIFDSYSYRHIVQIWNEDGRRLVTTILAIPNYRLQPTGETVIKFGERPAGLPQALRAWFYPGDNFGQEFVYPKARAIQLAQASNVIVPAETVEPTEGNLRTVPLVAVTPEKKEQPVTEAIQVLPLHKLPETAATVPTTPAPTETTEELPKTASSVFLIGLLGLASIALAAGLRLFNR